MRIVILSVLLLCSLQLSVEAQHQTEKREPPFITLIDVGLGTTSIELGISARVSENLATGLFAWRFHNPRFYNLESWNMIAARTKYYMLDSDLRTEPFIGVIVGAHGFREGIHPIIGLSSGFDIYAGDDIREDKILTRTSLELSAGIDARGTGFIGATLSFGLGWIDNESEPYSTY